MQSIVFKEIRFKNFMSYGNSFTLFKFDNNLNLIVGNNGVGKSSIFYALYYVLFGKTHNTKTLNSLINTVNNKELLVELDIIINDIFYKIIRGISPNVFEIYKNNELIPQLHSVTDYQKLLEVSILKFNSQAFKNLIYLGGDLLSLSFIKLSKKEKEEVFSILSDTAIFLKIVNSVKLLKKEKITEKTNIEYKMNTLMDLISKENAIYESNLKRFKDWEKINNNNINNITEKIRNEKENVKNIDDINKQILEIQQNINNINFKNEMINEEIQDYEKKLHIEKKFQTCGNCEKLQSIIGKKVDLNEYNKIKIMYENNVTKQNELNDTLKILTINLNSSKLSLEKIKEYENTLEIISNESVTEPDNSNIELLKNDLEKIDKEHKDISKYIEHLNEFENLLSTDNIKGLFLEYSLPFINQTINKFLNKFENLNIFFELDKTLTEHIKKDSKIFDVKSLSNGELLRLTYAISLAFLDICRHKFNVKINILILDEALDSSLDSIGKLELLNILSEFKDIGLYIISHNAEIKNQTYYFDKVIEIKKVGKFSKIEYLHENKN